MTFVGLPLLCKGGEKNPTLEEQWRNICISAQMFSLLFSHSAPLQSDPKTQTPARGSPPTNHKDRCQTELVNPWFKYKDIIFYESNP